jgi:hypothetical protein
MRCSVNATSGCPTALPLRLASVSLPAGLGLADTSHFRVPRALPTNALSGILAGLSRSSRLPLPLPYCSLLALARQTGSLSQTPFPTPFRRIFHRLALGTARHSEPRPQASPVALVHQSPYPRVSAFLVHSASYSLYSSSHCSALPEKKTFGTMASADPCQFSLTFQSGFPVFWFTGRSPQVKVLTFPARLARLLPKPLIALGFVVLCQLARFRQPLTRFVFLKPQVCFRLPPDIPSR